MYLLVLFMLFVVCSRIHDFQLIVQLISVIPLNFIIVVVVGIIVPISSVGSPAEWMILLCGNHEVIWIYIVQEKEYTMIKKEDEKKSK